MALYLLATAVDGTTVLTAAIWNAEFRNIYQNALALVSPLTGTLNANSNQITNHRQENVVATPTAAAAGRLVFHTTYKQLLLDDGTQIRYLPVFYGTPATGSIVYATSSGQYGALPIGNTFEALVATGGIPAWVSSLNPSHIDVRGSMTIGGGSNITKVMTATGSCVWPAMNSGATISTSITVTGATGANTDQVIVSHSAVTTASVLLYGYVSATNTVTVSLYNGTGATYNPGSGTLRATLIQYV